MFRCYLCSNDAFTIRKGVVRDNPSLKVVECIACGLVTLDSLQHMQSSHYESAATHVNDAASPEHASMESWLRFSERDDRRRFEALKPLLANRRVLDFGCGAGGFVKLSADVASSVAGVELERRVREHWGKSLPIFGSIADAGRDYDVITAFHVVEHLPDPRQTLHELAAPLARGGRLVVEVPSASDAMIQIYDSDPFQRFTYWSEHLFLFNAATMATLARQAGFRVVSVEQVQRYPLSNHLYWLSRGLPGGHRQWSFLDTPALTAAYADSLAAHGMCDTIVAHLELAAA